MDLDARIRRRQRRNGDRRLVRNYESLSPVAHVEEPTGRGPTFERLLDHLDPVFDGNLPPNAYVHGPAGSGKSAVVTALFAHLRRLPTETRSVIQTSTRATSPPSPAFAYLDLRTTTSEFAFYRGVLGALTEESVPEHGISTDEVRRRLHARLGGSRTGVVIAVDHVDTAEGVDPGELRDRFAGLPSNVSWLAVGREDPEPAELAAYTATSVRVGRYPRQTLVDVVMARASTGLAPQALGHDLARRVADWADGDAHDALAALFAAADRAERDGRTRLADRDVAAAIDEVPRPSVSLGRVLALPPNEQLVLRELVDLDASERTSVTETTDAISASPAVDLSAGTVKRYLYEMAETGVVERVRSEGETGRGRPPSRIEFRFPPTVFRRLYDLGR
ncbi:Cdc6/Cdc18 family protein [Candidatus Halobonum tyrrellensis]|uniref:Cell division control protein 6-like protein n=1 Tax=Candidatus Halobonum tyrrellensis G22 TaxID=1324957 RepID=V4GY25_9EURY|nr:AAA family ATPase [Candidatus Halobonum tyrrellensis]ESP90076.1 cell division control protein 6-like protein [Candidatus Halobonum tyrrellensis G22]